jgi:hypothetical protein
MIKVQGKIDQGEVNLHLVFLYFYVRGRNHQIAGKS